MSRFSFAPCATYTTILDFQDNAGSSQWGLGMPLMLFLRHIVPQVTYPVGMTMSTKYVTPSLLTSLPAPSFFSPCQSFPAEMARQELECCIKHSKYRKLCPQEELQNHHRWLEITYCGFTKATDVFKCNIFGLCSTI